ncbi:MAG: type I-C CRISPR-associated protein Cas8c/Csd1 [Rhizomicrobium sp.]|nr:type I-C CRISPR-associated protein Cas8c/Csd1 [Rhizomicrobium sp.]
MSALAALVGAYDRMAERGEVPPFGYSTEKIGFVISLNEDGTPAGIPADLREVSGREKKSRLMPVPASFKRPGVTPRPFFLWDNTAFAIGVTASDSKDPVIRFDAFRKKHLNVLQNSTDAGLLALRRFVECWNATDFASLGWPEEMKDQNVVFALESERLSGRYIHDRAAARSLWAQLAAEDKKGQAVCLITGIRGPIARLHPAIKGVWGAQSSGASIVSFNIDAFESYGHSQGDNAPVSEAAAFAYTTVLNKFLETGSRNRLQIGDTSTVFWAEASDAARADTAENIFAAFVNPAEDDAVAAEKISSILHKLRQGLPLKSFAPDLAEGVRFYVLGLAPNAARLSVRFWFESNFGEITTNYQRYLRDMAITPPPYKAQVPLWRYLIELAVLGKRENIPPNLAGEWLRGILSGTPYPATLLSAVLMRLRADRDVNAYRIAMLKAVLVRNMKKENTPVALDLENREKGYLLGRLFAVYEQVQTAALGRDVNATIKDKFYGAASAQPRKVFCLLDKGSANHLAKVGKTSPGRRVNLEKDIAAIMDVMAPGEDPFPAALSSADQALFGLGYYHQRSEYFKSRKDASAPAEEHTP